MTEFEEKLREFMRENLTIKIKEDPGVFSTNAIVVELYLGDEKISEDSMFVPERTSYCDY